MIIITTIVGEKKSRRKTFQGKVLETIKEDAKSVKITNVDTENLNVNITYNT